MKTLTVNLDQEELEDLLHGRRKVVPFHFDDIKVEVTCGEE